MQIEQQTASGLQIGHFLLIDIVGYSKLLVETQIEVVQTLNRIVRETVQFKAAESAGELKRLPTGDGMALIFFDSGETPLRCAIEISAAMKAHPELQLRMGAHSGPISETMDVNDRANFAGAGINTAQRVLDCGDAGHILVSKRLADDLSAYRQWHGCLHDLGECEVKHGVLLHLFNLCRDELGNPALPAKLREQQTFRKRWRRWSHRSLLRRALLWCACALTATAIVLGVWRLRSGGDSHGSSLAVLPFSNQSDDKTNADFTRGVEDELLTDLSRVTGLKVISSTSVASYKPDLPRNLKEIGKALGVKYLLEGSVRTIGNHVRVHAQLIDAKTDAHVWANRYDREIGDVFAIQSEVAEEIVAQLKLKLSPEERQAIEERPTNDLAAYERYVRAKNLITSSDSSARGNEDLLEAARLLSEAVTRDPGFFRAYYQLAHAYDYLSLRLDRNPEYLELAENAIGNLKRLRPDAGETHVAIAKHVYSANRDYEKARKELLLGQQKLRNDPEPALLIAYIDRRQSRWTDAISNFKRALEFDPRNSVILQQLALCYFSLHRYRDAAETMDRAVALTPDDVGVKSRRALLDLEWRADTKPLRTVLESIVGSDLAAAGVVADKLLILGIADRDPGTAERGVAAMGPSGCHDETLLFPLGWCEGLSAQVAGDANAAHAAFRKARAEAGEELQKHPQDAESTSVVALIDAALGQKEDAIRAGKQAVQMMPVQRDAVTGAILRNNLAIIYAMTGEKDLALSELAYLAANPSYLSYGQLRLFPEWDLLRDDPRFEQIVASLAPK